MPNIVLHNSKQSANVKCNLEHTPAGISSRISKLITTKKSQDIDVGNYSPTHQDNVNLRNVGKWPSGRYIVFETQGDYAWSKENHAPNSNLRVQITSWA